MASPIKLISTDFDGTLFAEFESPPIPFPLQQLLRELQAGGVKWAINTGRDMSSLMEALARGGIEVEPDYLVLVEREIHLHRDSQYTPLEEWNQACVRDHARVFAQVGRDLPRLVDWINARFHARMYEDAYSPFCIIAGNNEDMDVIHRFLEDYCRGVPRLAVVRNDVYARFCHEAYNKGTALAELCRRSGIGADAVFAAGDHLNDLPMLCRRYARYLAAPANAAPPVKEALRQQGGYISLQSHGLGTLEALNYYLEES